MHKNEKDIVKEVETESFEEKKRTMYRLAKFGTLDRLGRLYIEYSMGNWRRLEWLDALDRLIRWSR